MPRKRAPGSAPPAARRSNPRPPPALRSAASDPAAPLQPGELDLLRQAAIQTISRSLHEAAMVLVGLLDDEDSAIRRSTALDILAFGGILLGTSRKDGKEGQPEADNKVTSMLAEAVQGLVKMASRDLSADEIASIRGSFSFEDAEVQPEKPPAAAMTAGQGLSGLDPAVEKALTGDA